MVLIVHFPVDISGTFMGESPDYLLLSGTVVGENPDHVCWVSDNRSDFESDLKCQTFAVLVAAKARRNTVQIMLRRPRRIRLQFSHLRFKRPNILRTWDELLR